MEIQNTLVTLSPVNTFILDISHVLPWTTQGKVW